MPLNLVLITCLALTLPAGDQAKDEKSKVARPPMAETSGATLDALLRKCEHKRKEIKSFRCEFEQTREEPAFHTKTVSYGEAVGVGQDLLLITLKDRDRVRTKVVLFAGANLEWYDFENKCKWVIETKDLKVMGWLGTLLFRWPEGYRSFFPTMSVREAKAKYRLEILREPDEYYDYIKVSPRSTSDAAAFQEACVALSKDKTFPRTIIVCDPNGNRTKLDFAKVELNLKSPATLQSIRKELPADFRDVMKEWKARSAEKP